MSFVEQVDRHDLGREQVQQKTPESESRYKLRTVELLEPGPGPADPREMLLRHRPEAEDVAHRFVAANGHHGVDANDEDDHDPTKVCFAENEFFANEIWKKVFEAGCATIVTSRNLKLHSGTSGGAA